MSKCGKVDSLGLLHGCFFNQFFNPFEGNTLFVLLCTLSSLLFCTNYSQLRIALSFSSISQPRTQDASILNIPYSQSSAKLPVIRSSGHQVIRSSGHLVIWSSGHLVIWSSGHQVNMSLDHAVIRSSSHQIIMSLDH